jgi:hypothetical protein
MNCFSEFLSVLTNFGYMLLINVSYYMIYYYTKVEMYAKPKYKFLTDAYYKNIPRAEIECEYVKEGMIVSSMDSYDFVVYSDVLNNSSPVAKIIKQIPLLKGEKLKYEVSNEKFIMVELAVKDITISIKFSTNEYNYFVVGNIFNHQFIKYFLNKHHGDFLGKHNITLNEINKYSLKIMDSNVMSQEFNEKQNIVIMKHVYSWF